MSNGRYNFQEYIDNAIEGVSIGPHMLSLVKNLYKKCVAFLGGKS